MNSIQNKLIGTWHLVHSIEIDAAGQWQYPFGADAIGTIMYDAAGNMAVQICSLQPQRNPGYLAYFGTYEINEAEQLILHQVKGALAPSYIHTIQLRKYHFFADKLSLKPWDGTNREILWQKNKEKKSCYSQPQSISKPSAKWTLIAPHTMLT